MKESIIIVGAGITGLAAAYVLSPKYSITIVARDLPGDLGTNWASPWAGAVFHPQNKANKSQQEMQKSSFKFYWDLAQKDSSSGVKKYPMTEYFDDRIGDSDIWYSTLMPDYRVVPKSELPEGVSMGVKYTALAMNPLLLLPWLKTKLEERGVKLIRREIKSLDEAKKIIKAKIVVNASGVGARELASDDAVRPIRGQTMFVKTDFSQLFMREGSEYTYIIPRAGSGGVIMGGIKSDRLDTDVDVELKSNILKRVNHMTKGVFEGLDLGSVTDIVGFRPGRISGLRVEREGDVVHAYGAEGAGYIYSFGVADTVRELIEGRS
ncbi:FAD dependent oxidoreductase [Stipitochalara longipes BDJ]|nr:FAD dependent oxidoreductase [Stipitochalara longipes BDJ]